MKRIALLNISANALQLESVLKMIEASPENAYLCSRKLDGIHSPNLRSAVEHIEFLEYCCDANELVVIADENYKLEEQVLNSFFSNSLGTVWHIQSNGELAPYRLNPVRKSGLLLVFPGPILPLTLGSHQRAFNLLFNLSKNGVAVDVLITTPKNQNPLAYKKALGSICNNVYVYKNNKRKLKKIDLFKRDVEGFVRNITGKKQDLPDFFSERSYTRPTESCKKWVNSLYLANNYKSIIISYAWMMDSVKYIEHDKDRFKLICDTHDVQFTRNMSILNRKERLFFNSVREKKLEIRYLNKCDAVLAISGSDEAVLKRTLKKSTKVIRASAGFDYALSEIKRRPPGRPLNFGFIGGQMSANVQSLLFILENWWPTIKENSPDSKLFIAGSVSKSPLIISETFYDQSIVALGFVKTIDEFYKAIDISLNPVLVQGGLNFKSVEAVFSGKHLFTNRLGQACLGKEFPATIIEEQGDLVEFISKYEFDLNTERTLRQSNQKKAKEMFSNNSTYQELISYFSSQY